MIKEAYVSFEVAKLLKEKGFNEKCRGGYHYEFDDNDNPIVMLEEWTTQPYNNDFVDEGFVCSAPTIQMALAWLREIHNIDISVSPEIGMSGTKIYVPIISTYSTFTDKESKLSQRKIKLHYDFDIYEEAIEAALKYSLENLI